MQSAVNLYPLFGVVVIVAGFLLRFNPMLIVTVAAIITGLAAHFPVDRILIAIGSGFVKTRVIPLIILFPLAVIGLLERHGLRERAQTWIGGIRAATPGRLLIAYLFVREITAALGLTGLGGHPQMVRPLVAPMAEGAALARFGKLRDPARFRLRAFAAATDNVGLFFGEDIFVAFGAIVLMVTFLKETGIVVEPMRVALWGMPTALAAFLVHSFRLYRLDGWLGRHAAADEDAASANEPSVDAPGNPRRDGVVGAGQGEQA
ncbi:hypothetical protein DR64_8419 [Paraburkholderia xenovorans LB400]|uniref:Membrane protein n=1 Tax=Paraburkholderia xenovorans (strain LB400) TaxID=266265 RepID=Q13J06_PARXL|nr:DUF969 domain-containing protein [Paraburkholderia xenovorans]ABE35933.1 putative membrane protein [Paraburkholderia xenovorans LB400]AIP34299.1 hypothetical protein DR64_8419 [Paraburkholderia xenovorans LB400]